MQDRALMILRMLDTKDAEERKVDQVRTAVLIANPPQERVARVFPEYFPTAGFEDAVDENGEFDIDKIDDSKVEWATSVTPEEDDDISRWIAQRERGQMSLADLGDEGGWM